MVESEIVDDTMKEHLDAKIVASAGANVLVLQANLGCSTIPWSSEVAGEPLLIAIFDFYGQK